MFGVGRGSAAEEIEAEAAPALGRIEITVGILAAFIQPSVATIKEAIKSTFFVNFIIFCPL